MNIAFLSDHGIEEYTNHLGQFLYNRDMVIKDKITLEEKTTIRLIFTDYLEKYVIEQALQDNELNEIKNIKDIKFIKNVNYLELNLTEIEIQFRNMLVYDYFKITQKEWDDLETNTYSGLCDLIDLLEEKLTSNEFNKLDIYRMNIDDTLSLITDNINEIQSIESRNYLNEFLKFSTEKQSLIIKNISLW